MRCHYELTGRTRGPLHEMRCTRRHCRRTHWSIHPPERCASMCGAPLTSLGLGDTLAKWIHFLTLGRVTPCAACNSRRAWLNRKFPYGKPWRWWLARLRRIHEE